MSHPSDFEVEMEMETDHVDLMDECKLSQLKDFKEGLHSGNRLEINTAGGMGTTRLDLEDALDDGLSIVASSGFIYEHSATHSDHSPLTELPVPSSNTNESTPSTLSTSYAPRKSRECHPPEMDNDIASSTIDEEKETGMQST